MGKYKEYKGLNLPEIDKSIAEYWSANNIFDKSVNERSKDNTFVFYEGPPSANGMPGIHHVMGRTVKDLFCRFQTMKGKRVERKGGWDTHGLPVELSVEKALGITKEDIGKTITIEEYNQKCRETVMQYKDVWDDITVKMGYWVDLNDPYITFENNYIESVWWLLKQLHNKEYLYKGYSIQPYSPAAGTGLSTHELNQPGCYQDVTDTTVTAQFETIADTLPEALQGKGDISILAWTTTPWTLPSNTALTVGPKIDYVLVKSYNQYTHEANQVILAKALVGKQFSGKFTEVESEEELAAYNKGDKKIPFLQTIEIKGTDLIGIRYKQLLEYALPYENADNAFRVIGGDFVTTEDGTGPEGEAPDRSVDVEIAIKLKEENKAFKVEKYVHSYPHCWRTDKPVLYYPLDSWFVKTTASRERMIELNKTINWKPSHTGEKRFGNWLENLQDWNLSRSRYWGIPLPVWRTEDGTKEKCIGSIEELNKEIAIANDKLGLSQESPKDLHRPYIDDVVLVSDSGEKMTRELDLIDVWFDSGSMPYAQLHYPFENKEHFEKNYPADFIAEGVDQTRGWFFTLHAIASMVFDSVAYKNVVSNGLVLAKDGVKMSKRLGNTIDPFETIDKYGADATRWYMISNASPWDNLKFDLDGIVEVQRKFFGTLYNTYSFFTLYANIDGFAYEQDKIALADRPEIDRWVISLLNTLKKDVEADYANYEPTMATRKIQNFVDEHLSNWYVRLCRRRFWKGEYEADKIAAYQTLYESMITISKMMAPVAPFFADWLYQNLNGATNLESHESVHLALFPDADESAIDEKLEERMNYAQRISSLVLSLRKKDNLRVRQPLQKIMLPVLDPSFQDQVEAVKDLIMAEVNVKQIEYISDTDGVIKKKAKPNFKTLGRMLGANMKAGVGVITAFDQATISEIEKTNSYTLELNGTTYDLTLADIEIISEDIPGWQVASDKGLTVALDVQLNDALIAEGTARELVNRIQNLRKSNDLNIVDRIEVKVTANEQVTNALATFSDYICNEVLANSIIAVDDLSSGEQVELLEGESIYIDVQKA